MSNKAKKVGTVQLAEEFGVNIATISRALNSKPGVSADLRKRIVARARELSYQPNLFTRVMSGQRTHLVGVMGPGKQLDAFGKQFNAFESPFWGRIFNGIEEEAREVGYDLLFGCSGAFTKDGEALLPHFLKQKRVDGVLVVDTLPEEGLRALENSGLPFVQIDFDDSPHHHAVVSDNRGGCREATRHLIQLGHSELLFIGNPQYHSNFRLRYEGFQEAIATPGVRGYTLNREQVQRFFGDYVQRRSVILEVLTKHIGITAIIFENDRAALTTKNILLHEGWRIPEDFSLVGFDDLNLTSETFPPLTTVRVNKRLMGRRSFRLLIESLEEPPVSAETRQVIFCPTNLVERESTATPRAHVLPAGRS